MPQCQHHHHVVNLKILVKRHVARLPSGNDQLAEAFLGLPPDERMAFKNLQCLDDQRGHGACRGGILGSDELEYPIEIGLGTCREG